MKSKLLIASVLFSFGLLACNQADANSGNNLPGSKENSKEITNEDVKTDKPIKLTKEEFIKKVMNFEKNQTEWVYEGDKPCLIDFWADWCGPCKKAAPVLEELAKEYAGDIYIYKINTDEERELAGLFGIRNIPAFLFVPMEGKPQMTSGIKRTHQETKIMFTELIDELLLNKPKVE